MHKERLFILKAGIPEMLNVDDSIKGNGEDKQKEKKKHRKIIGLSILGVLLVLIIAAGIYIYQAIKLPESLFNTFSYHQQLTPKPIAEDIVTATNIPSAQPMPSAEPSPKQDIVNVLLLGIDPDKKPYAANGGDYHTDSIIVLAINFKKSTVDMISLPRDTFTLVPGIKGIYKLNAAINCGGGKTEAGFKKVCEAASWMLGGISIDYYYAFELDTVIKVGDMIGGVEFDVDMSYTGSSGTHYKKGMQHLDGTGIYDYMRARQNATGESGDKGRMNRGKAMLEAIFLKLKEQNMLTQMPSLLSTVNDGLYTNTNLQQAIALVNFAYNNINAANIRIHTMKGKVRSALSWNFCFIDQDARKELIKQVYGIDVPEQQYVSYYFANWLDEYGFKTIRYLATAFGLLQYIQSKGAGTLTPDQQDSYTALSEAYEKTQAAYDTAALALSRDYNKAMVKERNELRKCTEALAKSIGYPNKLSWSVKSAWYKDSCINEVDVDFN